MMKKSQIKSQKDKDNLWFLSDDDEEDEEEDLRISLSKLFDEDDDDDDDDEEEDDDDDDDEEEDEDDDDDDEDDDDLEPGRKPAKLSVGAAILKSKLQNMVNSKQKKNEKAKETSDDVDDDSWITDFFRPVTTSEGNSVDETDESKRKPETANQKPGQRVVEADEVKILDDWLIKERINEPLSDIPEYNLLLDLAADYEKNYQILLKVLTPTSMFENTETEDNKLAEPAVSPFGMLPENPENLMMQPPPKPVPLVGLRIDKERPSTSKEAIKALPILGNIKKILPVPMEYAMPQAGLPQMPRIVVPSSPARTVHTAVMPVTPTIRNFVMNPETPQPRMVVPSSPVRTVRTSVMPGTPTIRNYVIKPETPQAGVPQIPRLVVPSSPARTVHTSVMPGTPTIRNYVIKPQTPQSGVPQVPRMVVPSSPARPVTTPVVMPGTPTIRMFVKKPETPQASGLTQMPRMIVPSSPARTVTTPVMPGTPTIRNYVMKPETPKAGVPQIPRLVVPASPAREVRTPVMPGTPTIRMFIKKPETPQAGQPRIIVPSSPARPVRMPVLPGTPTIQNLIKKPETPQAGVPQMPRMIVPSSPARTVRTSVMPGTPTIRMVIKKPETPQAGPNRIIVPSSPARPVRTQVMPGTPTIRNFVKKPETPKQAPRQVPAGGLRIDQERPSTSKEAMKALALANASREVTNAVPMLGQFPLLWEHGKPQADLPLFPRPDFLQFARPDFPQLTQVEVPPLPGPVPSPPPSNDAEKMKSWLQVSNNIVCRQMLYIEAKDKTDIKVDNPSSLETLSNAIFDEDILGYTKQQVKILSAKWLQIFGIESVINLRRSLEIPLPDSEVATTRSLSNCRVLCVDMKYTNNYCCVQVNSTLNLRIAARSLDRAFYKHHIDVIQHSFDTIRMSWMWPDGTVMIINGFTQSALLDTQDMLIPKLVDLNFKGAPSIQINYLRLISHTSYPWPINLLKFSQGETLCGPLFGEKYVYYVVKDMPGVIARMQETGEVQVFAMDTTRADTLLTRLYSIAAKYQVSELPPPQDAPNH